MRCIANRQGHIQPQMIKSISCSQGQNNNLTFRSSFQNPIFLMNNVPYPRSIFCAFFDTISSSSNPRRRCLIAKTSILKMIRKFRVIGAKSSVCQVFHHFALLIYMLFTPLLIFIVKWNFYFSISKFRWNSPLFSGSLDQLTNALSAHSHHHRATVPPWTLLMPQRTWSNN